MSHKRSMAAKLARETVAILKQGRYSTPAGEVEIRTTLRPAIKETVSPPPDAALPRVPLRGLSTRFEVVNESTLAAARRLAADGFRVVALNFASARRPGGGFLGGAQAQEESLCR